MSDFEKEELVKRVHACSEEEKKVMLRQMDIRLLLEVVAEEITRLKAVEESGKRIFGV